MTKIHLDILIQAPSDWNRLKSEFFVFENFTEDLKEKFFLEVKTFKEEICEDYEEIDYILDTKIFYYFYLNAGKDLKRNHRYWSSLLRFIYFSMFYLGLNSSTVARLPLYFFKNLHEYGIVLEEAEKGLLENVVQQLEIEITDLSVSSKKQKKEKEGIHQYSIEGLQRALRRDMTIITETNQLPGMYIQASFITPALKRLTDKYGYDTFKKFQEGVRENKIQ